MAGAHGVKVSRSNLLPKRSGGLSVPRAAHQVPDAPVKDAAAVRVAFGVLPRLYMVFAALDGLGPENVIQLVAAGVLVGPLADRTEHVAVDLDPLISNGWVVECANDIVDDLVYRDTRVFPGIQNTTTVHLGQSSSGRGGRMILTARRTAESWRRFGQRMSSGCW